MVPADQDILNRHAVQQGGRGDRTLLLAHGFGCDQRLWRRLAPAFAQRFTVASFDHIGAGRSDRSAYDPVRHASIAGYAEDIVAVARALKLRQAVLVGHSVSAMAGLLASLAAPECFSHLVMLVPSPRYLNEPGTDGQPGYEGGFERADIDEMLDLMENNFQFWARALAPVAVNNPDQPELVEELGNSFGSMDPVIARRWARAIFLSDHRADLPRCRLPSLILQCRDDAIAPASVGRYMAAHMPGSTLHPLAATGHFPHMSHASEVIAALQDWFTTQGL